MAGIPRYRAYSGPALFASGFRPFFLAAAVWAAIGVPVWLVAYGSGLMPPSAMPSVLWHPHEMVYGYAAATVAGFLLTAIPNWTGRLPLNGIPLGVLVALWLIGRIAVLISGIIGPALAAACDLAFPVAFLAVVTREIVAGKNWRNLPMVGALLLLLIGNLLVHLDVLGTASTGLFGNRLGIATLLMLITLVGGRIVPSFTRNWLAKNRPGGQLPAPSDALDTTALLLAAAGILVWVFAPDGQAGTYATLVAGAAAFARLSRWRGLATLSEPLLWILHLGYGWLALGLLLYGLNGLFAFMPPTSVLHALTVGAIGTMTLAVMTRATLGHTGRPLSAGLVTRIVYILISVATLLRLIAPFCGSALLLVLWLAGGAWSAAFALFAVFYGRILARARAAPAEAAPV